VLIGPDGSNRRVLPAPFGYSISSVAWCGPDEIVYSQAEIAVAMGTGTTAHLVRHNLRTGVARQILWLPHNSRTLDILGPGRVIFDTRSSRENLLEIPLRGLSREIRWLTRGNSQDRQPVYSPDGSRLLFTSDRSGNTDLWELTLQTGAVRASPITLPKIRIPPTRPTERTSSGSLTAAASLRFGSLTPTATAHGD